MGPQVERFLPALFEIGIATAALNPCCDLYAICRRCTGNGHGHEMARRALRRRHSQPQMLPEILPTPRLLK